MKRAFLMLSLILFTFSLLIIPAYAQAEMQEFFSILIDGDAKWLFAIIFLGAGFLIAWKVRAFSLIMVMASLFMAIYYLATSPMTNELIWMSLAYWVSMVVFLFRLANVDLF